MVKEVYKLLEESRTDENDCLLIMYQRTSAAYETLYNQVIRWRKIFKKETGVE